MFRNIILAAVLITIPLVASISGYRQTNSGGEDIEAKLSNCYTYIHPPYEGQPTYNYNCNNSKQGLNGTLENASSQQTASKLLNEEDEEYDGQTPTVNRPNSEVALAEKVSKGVFELSQKLITRVLEQSQNKFEVMSPVSVSAALQLAFLGAKGSTYDELREVLGYNKGIIKIFNVNKTINCICF